MKRKLKLRSWVKVLLVYYILVVIFTYIYLLRIEQLAEMGL